MLTACVKIPEFLGPKSSVCLICPVQWTAENGALSCRPERAADVPHT